MPLEPWRLLHLVPAMLDCNGVQSVARALQILLRWCGTCRRINIRLRRQRGSRQSQQSAQYANVCREQHCVWNEVVRCVSAAIRVGSKAYMQFSLKRCYLSNLCSLKCICLLAEHCSLHRHAELASTCLCVQRKECQRTVPERTNDIHVHASHVCACMDSMLAAIQQNHSPPNGMPRIAALRFVHMICGDCVSHAALESHPIAACQSASAGCRSRRRKVVFNHCTRCCSAPVASCSHAVCLCARCSASCVSAGCSHA